MKTILIDYSTLKFYFFASHFKEPNTVGEIYYKLIDEGWEVQFFKNNFYVRALVHYDDLLEDNDSLIKSTSGKNVHGASSLPNYNRQYKMTKEQKQEFLKQKIAQFEVTYLKKAIKVLKFEGE